MPGFPSSPRFESRYSLWEVARSDHLPTRRRRQRSATRDSSYGGRGDHRGRQSRRHRWRKRRRGHTILGRGARPRESLLEQVTFSRVRARRSRSHSSVMTGGRALREAPRTPDSRARMPAPARPRPAASRDIERQVTYSQMYSHYGSAITQYED